MTKENADTRPNPQTRLAALAGLVLLGLFVELSDLTTSPALAYDGDIQMNRTAKQYGVPPVVFPHWAHRLQFTCGACHPGIFRMQAGGHEILMEKMAARGTFCLACHDGKVAWKPVNCGRCHQGSERAPENRDPELALKDFPRDPGRNVDWVGAIRRGLITPRSSLSGKRAEKAPIPADSLMRRTETLPAVGFPHASHALWLECRNCHPAIFAPKNGGNEISMAKIQAGQSCGVCHGKVAFPVDQCTRCHRGNPSR